MKGRNGEGLKFFAIAGAALTYAGAVIYGDIMFLQVVSKAFPGSGVLQALSYAGAIVTAVSALILPIALHWWFSPGKQFIWGLLFWGLDIFALGANSILAFEIATGSKDSFIEVWQVIKIGESHACPSCRVRWDVVPLRRCRVPPSNLTLLYPPVAVVALEHYRHTNNRHYDAEPDQHRPLC